MLDIVKKMKYFLRYQKNDFTCTQTTLQENAEAFYARLGELHRRYFQLFDTMLTVDDVESGGLVFILRRHRDNKW